MPFYQSKGKIPSKRHTILKKEDGKSIYYEELISREGFSNLYSNVYHIHMPTQLQKASSLIKSKEIPAHSDYKHRHLETSRIKTTGNIVDSRVKLFYNENVSISTSRITEEADYFYKNGHHDELIYIQSGEGSFESNFGKMQIQPGDYLIIPRGVVWKISNIKKLNCLVIESKSPIRTPKRYRNNFGQLMEHSPFCERDITVPSLLDPVDEIGNFTINVKYANGTQSYTYKNHPFDIVGWDGYYFPWKLNINDFEPITGSIHQPPPVHQTFEGDGFVVCSFVSRLFDYHPDAIPAPYPHSNIDSDELIYYSKGNFMSRKGISKESITHHPMGLPHGPQPGRYEESIGKKKTDELAVMVDTFKSLIPASACLKHEDKNYYKSWVK